MREYVPELVLADAEATERVTLRHLLAHTGGWFGDYFDDTGWGDDAAAIYVERMRELPQQTPVGELWAYNNAGFVLAGHVVACVTGKSVEDAMNELVLDPLELTSTTFWPWEVMTERFVVGHLSLREGGAQGLELGIRGLELPADPIGLQVAVRNDRHERNETDEQGVLDEVLAALAADANQQPRKSKR